LIEEPIHVSLASGVEKKNQQNIVFLTFHNI